MSYGLDTDPITWRLGLLKLRWMLQITNSVLRCFALTLIHKEPRRIVLVHLGRTYLYQRGYPSNLPARSPLCSSQGPKLHAPSVDLMHNPDLFLHPSAVDRVVTTRNTRYMGLQGASHTAMKTINSWIARTVQYNMHPFGTCEGNNREEVGIRTPAFVKGFLR